jgi:endonuclease G
MIGKRLLLEASVVFVLCSGLFGRYCIQEGGYQASQPTNGLAASLSPSPIRWQLRSKHLLWGVPALTDDRYSNPSDSAEPGVSVLVREGFVIGHFDRGRIPLWMSMRWTKADLAASQADKDRGRHFAVDDELPKDARGSPEYNSPGLDRGHLARNRDNSAWGEDNARMGDLMSNVVPQPAALNRGPWYELEKVVSNAPEKQLTEADTFWVIAGPVFEGGVVGETIGHGIAVPDSFFKIVAWTDRTGKFKAMAFIFPKDATVKNPTVYLSSVDELEKRTGIDFFPELTPSVEEEVEAYVPKRMWEMPR